MEKQEFTKATLIGHGADSVVFSLGNNESVLKIYDDLSINTIREYHQIHYDAAQRVQGELGGGLRFSGRIAGRAVRNINLRVLALTQDMVIPLPEELRGLVTTPDYSPITGITSSIVPYIGGKNLSSYGNEGSIVRDIVQYLSEELSELEIPVGGANEYNGIHPVNVKVFTEGTSDGISLVITDIGASIKGVLALNKLKQSNYPITSLGFDPSAGPTIPMDSRMSTTRAARP